MNSKTRNDVEHDAINDKLELLHADIRKIMDVLFVGNGHSMVTRLALCEDAIQDDNTSKNVRRAMFVAGISALGAVVAACVSAFGG